ncbi:MAG TPA: cysteine--tRNA ligase [Anaerolineales bacterium]|nr:cysteine--tRNA ligase [Anaerolineales bacterium]
MTLAVYNTLTDRKERFEPLESGVVRMYVCGPTVYDKAHIGHAMSSLVFDVIRRYLEYRGYRVLHVMNYTDVDDKVIHRAQQIGVEATELSERYIAEYDRHMQDFNLLAPLVKPRVSQEIENILRMVQGLIERGFAYPLDGDVYFEVAKDTDYGKLSGRRLEEMRAGARVEVDERKRGAADFALWKAAKPGEPSWPSPWGPGRPGWHIECSSMSLQHLGEQIDIHGGGNDLIFPHHENEIAQTESLTGKPFVRYWLHNGMMQLRGEDMSKSTGVMLTVDEFLSRHEADVLRLMVLNSHYRKPLTYTEESAEAGRGALERLRGGLKPAPAGAQQPANAPEELRAAGERAQHDFGAAMDDDFNTAVALSVLFELVREIHQARQAGVGSAALEQPQRVLLELAGVLGIRLEVDSRLGELGPELVELLIQVREELRAASHFALADQIRDRLGALGVLLEDGKHGTTWTARGQPGGER